MIRQSLKPNSIVFHEKFGFGTFIEWNTRHDIYEGYAVVQFKEYPGLTIIHRKRLTEVEK